jgi:hypothetical protein
LAIALGCEAPGQHVVVVSMYIPFLIQCLYLQTQHFQNLQLVEVSQSHPCGEFEYSGINGCFFLTIRELSKPSQFGPTFCFWHIAFE